MHLASVKMTSRGARLHEEAKVTHISPTWAFLKTTTGTVPAPIFYFRLMFHGTHHLSHREPKKPWFLHLSHIAAFKEYIGLRIGKPGLFLLTSVNR